MELGTGGALTAIALALGDHRRRVISYDTTAWPFREHYLQLVPPDVRSRIDLRQSAGRDAGPSLDDPAAQLLFIDSSHTEAETIASFNAWRHVTCARRDVVFHDYENADFPGVAAAIAPARALGCTLAAGCSSGGAPTKCLSSSDGGSAKR